MRARIYGDAAENSIMQTITIAVSAILIAAGLVTAPGLINDARDNNAKTDLANIAFSEEAAQADVGDYFIYDNHPDSTNTAIPTELVGFTPSATVRTLVLVEGDAFVALSKSSSGKVFFRSSLSAEVREATQDDLASEGVAFTLLAGTSQMFAGIQVPDVFAHGLLVDASQAVVDDEAFAFPTNNGNPGGGNPGGGNPGGNEVVQVPCSAVADPLGATSYGGKIETKTLTVCDSTGVIYSAVAWTDGENLTFDTSQHADASVSTADAGITFVLTATTTVTGGSIDSLEYTGYQSFTGLTVDCTTVGSPAAVGETTTITCVGTAPRGGAVIGSFVGSIVSFGNSNSYSSMGDLAVMVNP